MKQSTLTSVYITLTGFFVLLMGQGAIQHYEDKSQSRRSENSVANTSDSDDENTHASEIVDCSEIQVPETAIEYAAKADHGAMEHDSPQDDEANNTANQSTDWHSGRHNPKNTSQSIRHLRIAAENLRIAGMSDVARQVSKRADSLERELHESKMKPTVEMIEEQTRQLGEVQDVLRDLQKSVGQLRDDVKQLNGRIERR